MPSKAGPLRILAPFALLPPHLKPHKQERDSATPGAGGRRPPRPSSSPRIAATVPAAPRTRPREMTDVRPHVLASLRTRGRAGVQGSSARVEGSEFASFQPVREWGVDGRTSAATDHILGEGPGLRTTGGGVRACGE